MVTGASRGIGRGIALELAECGADVIGIYESSDGMAGEIRDAITRKGVMAEFFKCDVSKEEEVLAVREKALADFGKVDILVNNAGIHQHLKSWELSLGDWQRVLDVNLTGVFILCKAFIPHMKERGSGRIVNISSCVAYTGTDHEVHYAASKSGILALTKSLALELAPNINVNAVAPGYTATDMVVFESAEQEEVVLRSIPKGRIGQSADIAKAVAFLCSDDSDYITGQVLHVNGGLIMV